MSPPGGRTDAGAASGLADEVAVRPLALAIDLLGRRAERIEDVFNEGKRNLAFA